MTDKTEHGKELRSRSSSQLRIDSEGVPPDVWIRSLAGLIPWVGTAVGEALAYRWTAVRQRRVEEAFKEIARQIETLGEEKLDKSFVESDEFIHILALCFDGFVKEHDNDKRRYFANLLVNSMTNRMAGNRTKAEWFASVLSRLSHFHLVGFSLINADAAKRAAILNTLVESNGELRAVVACLHDLESAGFVDDLPSLSAAQEKQDYILSMLNSATLTENGEEFIEWVLE